MALNDEDYAYDDGAYDDSEDEENQLIRLKTNQQKSHRQQAAFKNNSTKGIGGFSGVSNNEKVSSANGPPANKPTSMPSSGGSHAEIDRRKIITVKAIANPRRFVPQTVTRDIIYGAEKWKDYPIKMKDELFNEFMMVELKNSRINNHLSCYVWD